MKVIDGGSCWWSGWSGGEMGGWDEVDVVVDGGCWTMVEFVA